MTPPLAGFPRIQSLLESRRAWPERLHRWIVFVILAGCGSSATILRPDQARRRGEIVRSDANALYLRPAGGTEELGRVERRDVADIDHPGNVAMLIGAALLGNFAVLLTQQDFRSELVHGARGDTSTGALPLTLMFAVPGVLLLGSGTYHYVSSKSAARAFEHPDHAAPP